MKKLFRIGIFDCLLTRGLVGAGLGFALAGLAAEKQTTPGQPSSLDDAPPLSGALVFEGGASFKKIFNGTDLTGWEGNPELWSVKDGAIVGQTTTEKPTKGNTFLIWKAGTTADFELRFSYKISSGNSGVQYRSKVVDAASWKVGGYQADFEAGTSYSGILYDEGGVAGGRQIMAARGEKVVWDKDCKKQVAGLVGKSEEIQAAIKKEDWNDYVIIAKGNHLQHFINGRPTVDVTDECEAKALKSGVLALQVHAGPPMKVEFKNLRIKQASGPSGASSDLDRMQGDWDVAELVVNGEKLSADLLASAKLNVKAADYSLSGDTGSSRGTLKLTESASPKSMEVTTDDGAQLPAIYEISGDTLKVCYAINGASRPKEFKSESGSDHIFTIYKRKAK